jgi:hypothetical protein
MKMKRDILYQNCTYSPSGYRVPKNNVVADATVYLPLDKRNAREFLKSFNWCFIKY